MNKLAALFAMTFVLVACGGAGAPLASPGTGPTAQPPVATQAPGGGATAAPVTGGLAALARELTPPASTEVSHFETPTSYQLIVSTTTPVDSLKQFWTQQIASLGITETGRFEMEGTLTIALTNPDGGILVVPGESGQHLVTISLGISS